MSESKTKKFTQLFHRRKAEQGKGKDKDGVVLKEDIPVDSNSGATVPEPPNEQEQEQHEKYGLFLIYEPPAGSEPCNIDFVAVHGLGGGWRRTWTDEDSGIFWLKDFLPKQYPKARVFSFGYDASRGLSNSKRSITNAASALVDNLVCERTNVGRRPIVFIAHSLGGIIVKQAIILAIERSEHWSDFSDNARGAIFFAVPHRGSASADWLKIATDIATVSTLSMAGNSELAKALRENSPELKRISEGFVQPAARFTIIRSFFETDKILSRLIVNEESSTLGTNNELAIPIQGANHRNICKFDNANSQKYKNVARALANMIPEILNATPLDKYEHDVPPRSKPVFTVPFRRDEDFVARKALDQLQQRCSKQAARVALVGLGGVGKSQLAIEYAYRTQNLSPKTSIFWVHAGSKGRFQDGYRRIATMSKIPGSEQKDANILRLCYEWLSHEDSGEWLMIIDNADDIEVLFHEPKEKLGKPATIAESFAEFLPQSQNGAILFTSRNREVAHNFIESSEDIIDVGPMSPEDSLALLQKKLQNVEKNTPDSRMCELIEVLDFMPLAISQAGAYIRHRAPQITVSKYLEHLEKGDKKFLNLDIKDPRRDNSASNSILATWQISFEYIKKKMPSAARLLSLMSLFDRQGIPGKLLEGNYDGVKQAGEIENLSNRSDFNDDIHVLRSYSLISVSLDCNEFEMHRLVQHSTKKWLEVRKALEPWKHTYIDIMNTSFPIANFENWALCRPLFPHAQLLLIYRPSVKNYLDKWAVTLRRLSVYTREAGDLPLATDLARGAVDGLTEVYGSDAEQTLMSLNELASSYTSRGLFNEAKTLNEELLKKRKRSFGDEHINTLTTMHNLARVYCELHKWREAAELLEKCIEIGARVFGAKEHWTLAALRSMSVLAQVYASEGSISRAEKLQVEILNKQKEILPPEHISTVRTMGRLASTYKLQGRFEEAENMAMEVMSIRKRVFGEDHPETLASMNNLGQIYFEQGNLSNTQQLGEEFSNKAQRVLREDHPNTLIGMSNLALIYHAQGNLNEAKQLHKEVLDRRQKILGDDYPYTLESMYNLGQIYFEQGNLSNAQQLGEEASSKAQRVLGEDHPNTLIGLNNLALIYRAQGNLNEAKQLHEEVLAKRQRVLGEEHPDTLISMANLAWVFHFQGNLIEAIKHMEQCIKLTSKSLGEDHSNTKERANWLKEWEEEFQDSSGASCEE